MAFSKQIEHSLVPDIHRISSLGDNIFSIAMTLLVLNIAIPNSAALSGAAFNQALLATAPAILAYAVSFWVIGIYWRSSNRILRITAKLDSTFIQLHLAYLLVIAFIPFPTSVVSAHQHESLAVTFYVLSLTLAGALVVAMCLYLQHHPYLLKEGTTRNQLSLFLKRSLVAPVVFLVSPIIAYWIPDFVIYSWALIYPLATLVERWHESGLALSSDREALSSAK
jgi:uncharacterized membrane protein